MSCKVQVGNKIGDGERWRELSERGSGEWDPVIRCFSSHGSLGQPSAMARKRVSGKPTAIRSPAVLHETGTQCFWTSRGPRLINRSKIAHLQQLNTRLAAVLCSLLWVTLLGQGVGLGDPQRSLPTLPCWDSV